MVYCRQEGPRPIKPAVWNLRLSRGSENKKAVSHKFQHALLACHKQQGWLSATGAVAEQSMEKKAVTETRKSIGTSEKYDLELQTSQKVCLE